METRGGSSDGIGLISSLESVSYVVGGEEL